MGRPCQCCDPYGGFRCGGDWSTVPADYSKRTWPSYLSPNWTREINPIENPTGVTMWLKNWAAGGGGALEHRINEPTINNLTGVEIVCPCQIDYGLGMGIVGYGVRNFLGIQFRNEDITGTRDAMDLVTLDDNLQPTSILFSNERTNPGRMYGPIGRLELERVMVAGSPQVNVAFRDPDNNRHYHENIGIAWPSLNALDWRIGFFGYGPAGAMGLSVFCNQDVEPNKCFAVCGTPWTPAGYYLQPEAGSVCSGGFPTGCTEDTGAPFAFTTPLFLSGFASGNPVAPYQDNCDASGGHSAPGLCGTGYVLYVGGTTSPFVTIPDPSLDAAWIRVVYEVAGTLILAEAWYTCVGFVCTNPSNTFTVYSETIDGTYCTGSFPPTARLTLEP